MNLRNRLIKLSLVFVLMAAGFIIIGRGKAVPADPGQTFLSPQLATLLDPADLNLESAKKTSWFDNIIPTAQAAPPFSNDGSNPRKLTIYGGVLTIVNGTSNVTHALEIGQERLGAQSLEGKGLALATTGNLYLVPNASQDLYVSPENPPRDFATTTLNSLYIGERPNESNLTVDRRDWEAKVNANNKVGIYANNPGADYALYVEQHWANNRGGGVNIYADNSPLATLRAVNRYGSGYSGYFLGKTYISKPYNKSGLTPPEHEALTDFNTNATLVVRNKEGGNIANDDLSKGSLGDAIYAIANSANAAISASQIGTGYAGYFSGRVYATPKLVVNRDGIFDLGTDNDAVYIRANNNTSGVTGAALRVVQDFAGSRAAWFSGNVYMYKGSTLAGRTELEARNVMLKVNTSEGRANLVGITSLESKVGDGGTAIKGTLDTVADGKAISGEVTSTVQDSSNPGIYAGYFKCPSGLFTYTKRCQAGYFEGPVGVFIPPSYSLGATTTGLNILNAEYRRPIGLNVEVGTSSWTSDGPLYGIRVVTGNHDNSGGTNLYNYGIWSEVGSAGTSGTRASYALYAKATGLSHVAYAGYFEGDVNVTGNLTHAGNKVLDRSCFLTSNEYGAGIQNPCPIDCGAGNTAVSRVNVSSFDNYTCVAICCPT